MFKKKLYALVISALFMLSVMVPSMVFASKTEPNVNNLKEVVNQLAKYEVPYFGEDPMDFDVTGDGEIDVFDLGVLKNKYNAGEAGITTATIEKLSAWLSNKKGSSLIIEELPQVQYRYTPIERINRRLEDLASSKFRMVHVSEYHYTNTEGTSYDFVVLHFLWKNEIAIDRVLFAPDNIYNSADEFDEFIAGSEEKGFYFGIKNGRYSLALNPPTENHLGQAYTIYDLSAPNFSNDEVLGLFKTIDEVFSSHDKYTVNASNNYKVNVRCENSNSIVEFIIYQEDANQFEKYITLFENEEFVLFYSNKCGFAFSKKY